MHGLISCLGPDVVKLLLLNNTEVTCMWWNPVVLSLKSGKESFSFRIILCLFGLKKRKKKENELDRFRSNQLHVQKEESQRDSFYQ